MRKYGESKTTRIMMALCRTSLPERDVRNITPMDFCSTECTNQLKIFYVYIYRIMYKFCSLISYHLQYIYFLFFISICKVGAAVSPGGHESFSKMEWGKGLMVISHSSSTNKTRQFKLCLFIWYVYPKVMFVLLLQQFLQASVAFKFNIVISTEHLYAWINVKQYVRKFLQ